MARYIDDAHGCRNSGMPLGGIGAGSVELRPDGYLYNWFLMNNAPWGTGQTTTCMERWGLRFLALCDDGSGWKSYHLGVHHGCEPKSEGWYWITDTYHLPWVVHPDGIDYRAKFPVAELGYNFPDAKMSVDLKAWSPFIPQDSAASNTPGAIFTFTLRNTSSKPIKASLVGLIKNGAGYDHPLESCTVRRIKAEGLTGLILGRSGLPDAGTSTGEMGLFLSGAKDSSWLIHPRNGRDVWDHLQETGRLEDRDCSGGQAGGDAGAESFGDGMDGYQRSALAAHVDLIPGEVQEITLLLTWHFPHFMEQEQEICACAKQPHREPCLQAKDIGVQYANRFEGVQSVATWLHTERKGLERRTDAIANAMRASSLPAWEIEAITASLSMLLRSAWWDKRGRFGIWEGLGCCGLQTIDVGHYGSFPVLQFFPDLDASANRLSAANRLPDDKVPHLMRGNFEAVDTKPGERGRVDLPAQFILAVWRYVRWTGKLDEARSLWSVLEANLAWLEAADTGGDGLPDNQGPDQTYDQFPIFGTGSFVAGLYLAALHAMGDLAELLGKGGAVYHEKRERLTKVYEQQLWNGSYYILSHDVTGGRGPNSGCMTDQVNADWFLRQCGGPGLLPDERVTLALRSVLKHNQRSTDRLSWLANCSWPEGGAPTRIPRRTSDQVNAPWSGTEYAFAAHCRLMGLIDEARLVARDVWQRYETAGMRFNHIECGHYYYRWMSAWAIYNAEFGISWDGIEHRLTLRPDGKDITCLVIVPGATVVAEFHPLNQAVKLKGLAGTLELRSLALDNTVITLETPVVVETDTMASVKLG